MTDSNKPNAIYWVIAVIALLWNGLGTLTYLTQAFMTDEVMAMLPAEQQEALANTPSWVTAMYAIAVWFGLLASIALLLRRKWAYPLFIISLIGVLGQNVYNFFMSNNAELYGAQAYIMPVVIILFGIFLIYYAKSSSAKGWLK